MKIILWDFDGTLAYRDGMWSGTLANLANQHHPEYNLTREIITPSLQAGFPWHSPETNFGERSSDEWWASMESVFYKAYLHAGVIPNQAVSLSQGVRREYTKLEYWTIYDDVLASLTYFQTRGWQHYILSNHVPELPVLVNALGLKQYFVEVFTSAQIGFEKPNQGFFKHVQSLLPEHEAIWMIGDSYNADVLGAEEVGIPAILVRKTHDAAKLQCRSLFDLRSIVE